MILELEAVGVDAAGQRFDLIGNRAVDARPVWPSILEDLFELNRRRFDTGGRVGGTPWKRDKRNTLRRKLRAHQDPRVMHAGHTLRRAATVRGARGQQVRMDPEQLLLGITLPYAGIVTKRRPIFRVPHDINESIASKLLRFIDEGHA